MKEMSISDHITYATVRIETDKGTGTGFFFRFKESLESNSFVPVVITNKHVIEGSDNAVLILTSKDKDGQPVDNKHLRVEYTEFEKAWKMHPDPEVDLCAMTFGNIINQFSSGGFEPYYITLDRSIIPSEDIINSLRALEEIVMVGYPNGLWDTNNNKPLLRKGVTALHPKFDYCGRKDIIIDAACYPGSSGSPVFLLNEGVYKHGSTVMAGDRVFLLGVLYAGPVQNISGEIEVVDIPTVQKPIALSQISINLGYVIKAHRILELEHLF
jgi:hypothetical protein